VLLLRCADSTDVKRTVIRLGFSLGNEVEDSAGGMIVADIDNDQHQKPFVFDSKGILAFHYEMDSVAPRIGPEAVLR